MSRIRLTWNNASTTIVGQRVYRSISPLDTDDMPAPLAVLPRRSREYLDSTIEDGLAYYYAVSSVLPDYSELISEEIKVEASHGESDPHWDKVVALLHFDGNFRNEAPFEVVQNSARLSATESRFGSGSMAGSRSSNRTISILTQQFGTQDFTVEFWYKRVTSGSNAAATVVDNRTATGTYTGFLLTCPGANPEGLAFYCGGPGSGWDSSITPEYILPLGQWVHVAAVRHGDQAMLFADGVKIGESIMPDNTNIDANNHVFFGGNLNGTASVSMPGFADELRISKGVARYTENFTPPTKAFPNN